MTPLRIVQTFWTAGRDPLAHGFGWPHPQYNLMSWALSCLCLRRCYGQVALYTDRQGLGALQGALGLPYTEARAVYDESLALPRHWALAKVRTYAMQDEPFLHVDGDVFLPRPVADDVAALPLVAQNKEVGTDYYRDMMRRILHSPTIELPQCVRTSLREEALASYNMGVFGGRDLGFVSRYCAEALRFVERNRMNDPACANSSVDCNIFFEQIILAAMADGEGVRVGSVVGHDMRDQGYTVREFCDLDDFGRVPLYHLLGGHKRNRRVLAMLARRLLLDAPELYARIAALFHRPGDIVLLLDGTGTVEALAGYRDFLGGALRDMAGIGLAERVALDGRVARGVAALRSAATPRGELLAEANPCLSLYSPPAPFPETAQELLRRKYDRGRFFPVEHIAVTPASVAPWHRESALLDTDLLVLSRLRGAARPLTEVTERAEAAYARKYRVSAALCREQVRAEVDFLVSNGYVLVRREGETNDN